MHEKHQVEHLVKNALEIAKQEEILKVKEVGILIGRGLGFDETSIKLYFETFTEETPLEGAELVFAWQEAELFCPKCKENFLKIKSNLECPKCQTQGLPTEVGKAFEINYLK